MNIIIKILRWLLIKTYSIKGYDVRYIYIVYFNETIVLSNFMNRTDKYPLLGKINLASYLNEDISNIIEQEARNN